MNDSEGEFFSRFRGSPGVDRISISVSGTIYRNEQDNPSNQGQKEKPVSDETRREIGERVASQRRKKLKMKKKKNH